MKESELLGKLLPGHPDILPIIKNIRDKYQIPEVDPEDDIGAILLTRDDIDWEVVKQDIDAQVRDLPFLNDSDAKYIQGIKNLQSMSLDFPELDCLSEDAKNTVKKVFSIVIQSYAPVIAILDSKLYRPLNEIVFEYLLTGKTRDVPEYWFGQVLTMNILGNPSVIVMAGEGSNPKELAEQFKGEFTRTFGKREHKITKTHLRTAEYLRMKLEGNSLKRLVERYQEKHPSEFPQDRTSKAYRKAIDKHKDMMEKRLIRLKDLIKKISGDKK